MYPMRRYLLALGDKGYDSEDIHILVRDVLHAFRVIPARCEYVVILKTYGGYRKVISMVIPACCLFSETPVEVSYVQQERLLPAH